jgi:TnpA family transposase
LQTTCCNDACCCACSPTGIRRVAAGDHPDTERDLHYIRRRYLTVANVRRAIREVVNATLAARDVHLWGEATTTASDSTKFGAWDQNLLTEWHARYRGPGVMIYWHVERRSLVRVQTTQGLNLVANRSDDRRRRPP